MLRLGSILLWLGCTGCHFSTTAEVETPAQETKETTEEEAGQLWQKGQEAMRQGKPQRAIGFYEESLRTDPTATGNWMSLAAAQLEVGDEPAACTSLGNYVQAHPEHLAMRSQYVELLLQLKKAVAAVGELEAMIAFAQELGDKAVAEIIHCHTQLVEIADDRDDLYAYHLHRGIGLYLLARQRAALGDEPCELSAESLLCRAASQLKRARRLRPSEARAAWYLHGVWAHLGRPRSAERSLADAVRLAAFSDLTPAEHLNVMLAAHTREAEASYNRKGCMRQDP
jgi:tetratricopeptide (TPR) repeat protein